VPSIYYPACRPDRFAAAVPIARAGDPSLAPLMKDVPFWIFVGQADPASPYSREMRDALFAAGGIPRHTEVLGADHEVHQIVYERQELYEWLFSRRSEVLFGNDGSPAFERLPSGSPGMRLRKQAVAHPTERHPPCRFRYGDRE
jgi:acetyl esterase/lipase